MQHLKFITASCLSILLIVCAMISPLEMFAQTTTTHPLTEDQKIEALIVGVEKATNIQFYRNGSYYDAATAASHLRLKRRKAGSAVKTAADFIDKLATKSSVSGEIYKIKYTNGTEISGKRLFLCPPKSIKRQQIRSIN